MSDEQLRELERRFKETDSTEDEAAWLIEALHGECEAILSVERDTTREQRSRTLESRLARFPPYVAASSGAEGEPHCERLAFVTAEILLGAIRGVSVGTTAFFVCQGTALKHARGQARRAIREEIVHWALGYRDPVRDRVEARLREAAE